MAILDKENRSRGLRVPSFAKKGFRQKTSDSLPTKESDPIQPTPPRSDSIPAPPLFRSQEQEVDEFSAPPSVQTSAAPASLINGHSQRPPYSPPDGPLPEPPVFRAYRPPIAPQPTPPSSEEDLESDPKHTSVGGNCLPEADRESEAPVDSASSEEDRGPWTPADYEPVAAPLNKLHYACYQDHRSMPPANNAWYALPCMTCQKFDHEVRHRCVFCCLRICGGCYQALQKCPNRSLAQLMRSLPASQS
ncbi:uncharacterized protein BP01DRAFT_355669 [Aspergillus saccharolyticus JOP 1030-1]|uniref:Uncharacterized protein n=1 Tax=Aspergillus saccharolyticus JOP 1030-1 TaxID=1450539 RepID=A0A318ZJX1_9EURO|nr:hypothetical protein BP01DRAFT_355669 [Aspergillus saccharolyticus JOP 1030-1]PYH46674.1 hypothetical protein BP01DRAFT_355669 [Aspergillus saccharolyticus JOP 1030-1]